MSSDGGKAWGVHLERVSLRCLVHSQVERSSRLLSMNLQFQGEKVLKMYIGNHWHINDIKNQESGWRWPREWVQTKRRGSTDRWRGAGQHGSPSSAPSTFLHVLQRLQGDSFNLKKNSAKGYDYYPHFTEEESWGPEDWVSKSITISYYELMK